MSTTYIFRIEGCTPDDIPIDRLGKYIGNLARMMRHSNGIHLQGLKTGSTNLALKVDRDYEQRVAEQIAAVKSGQANKDALKAEKIINELLKKNNATGFLAEGEDAERKIIRFPGARGEQQETLGPFDQNGSLDGVLTGVRGKGEKMRIWLSNGELRYTGIETDRDTGCELARHMHRHLRIFGTGRWLRNEQGKWCLQEFHLDRFEVLKTDTLRDLVDQLRAQGDFAWKDVEDPHGTLKALR